MFQKGPNVVELGSEYLHFVFHAQLSGQHLAQKVISRGPLWPLLNSTAPPVLIFVQPSSWKLIFISHSPEIHIASDVFFMPLDFLKTYSFSPIGKPERRIQR